MTEAYSCIYAHTPPRQAPENDHIHVYNGVTHHLQYVWSQMSETPRNSSNGGTFRDPGGRTELYDALTSSYLHRWWLKASMKR